MCREFGVVNSTNQTIWKNRTKINSTLEENQSIVKRFRKPERSDVDEALLEVAKLTLRLLMSYIYIYIYIWRTHS